MSRAYTVAEIDALRRVCDNRWIWGTSYFPVTGSGRSTSRSYQESDRTKGVEELVRTAMLAGHIAEDIIAADRERYEQMEKAREAIRKVEAQ